MSEMNGENCQVRYTVKRGDSFYLIAHRMGVTLRDLLEANPDIPPSRLTVGDVLCIPYGQTVQTPACDSGSDAGGQQPENGTDMPETGYACPANRQTVVQNGQTLSDLQLRYNLSYHTLKTANPDTDLDDLQGGQTLCVPESNIACPLPVSVVLGDNDTLSTAALRYNVTVRDLLRANPCLAPEDFRAGAEIRLPD